MDGNVKESNVLAFMLKALNYSEETFFFVVYLYINSIMSGPFRDAFNTTEMKTCSRVSCYKPWKVKPAATVYYTDRELTPSILRTT